jgi:hypothetical protein
MDRDFQFADLGLSSQYDNSLNNSMLPDTSNTNLWPVQYTFSDTNGNSSRTSVSISATNFEALNSQYTGLQGIAQDCTITSIATPVGQRFTVPATVSQSFQAAQIPVFQFAIFYNLNMEIDPGQAMNVQGSVFCNDSIWAEGSAGLTFSSTVQAVGTVNTTTTDPFSDPSGTYTGSGTPTFLLGGQPVPGCNSLNLPIGTSTNSNPTNIEAIINLPQGSLGAPNPTAYAPSNQVYLFNESDLIISNASWGINGVAFNGLVGGTTGTTVNTEATNFTVWFQDQFGSPILKKLTNDYIIQKKPGTNYASTNILYAGYSFLTNVTFGDWREGWNGGSGPAKNVQAVQIDIAKFNKWLTNTAGEGPQRNTACLSDFGHGIGSIYVFNSVPLTTTTLPAVRLINGSMLPTNYPGLTVSTAQPLYIFGDYNVSNSIGNDLGTNRTTHTYPAAVMADSITILSDGWNDSSAKNAGTGANTTVNCAMLEGIVQTDPTISGDYSGGVENFMRLLETWGSTLTYNGSIVVMFPSIYATNHWHTTGNYYNAPTRHWAFDLNFKTAAGLPPCTPKSRAFIRGNWFAY